ncbi:hypothetical protein DM02DRAFT_635284 [Periconia macrospinosa]|uniref:Geranylgeranyl pyrophosphate synthetase n=1 Tax=Periconia macrospinosa TaxID=97972 RepID=A0A2V1D4U3_9PLEO|nr:hypothetical protein DM02DRAFT_635284 [Periconia macrospinosa]
MDQSFIAEISRSSLQAPEGSETSSIREVKHLASYNWIEAPQETPTIAVPGSPNLWTPPNGPTALRKDNGWVYINQNAARHPDSPLEPLFRALYFQIPTFDITGVDIVTDRNNIRKLLGFINPRHYGSKRESFTIYVEVVKNTAIFSREEPRNEEYIQPHQFAGYGHSFEEHYTTRQVDGSTGHHRIISYRFGNLNMMVRHETDGYINTNTNNNNTNMTRHHQQPTSTTTISLLPPSINPNPTTTTLQILPTTTSPHSPPSLPSTLELKTRASHRHLPFPTIAAQLWISQTPNLVRAYHTYGMFPTPSVENVTARVKEWEEDNQDDLGRLEGLLAEVRSVVKEEGDGRAIVWYDGRSECLEVWGVARGEGRMLPGDLYARWQQVD